MWMERIFIVKSNFCDNNITGIFSVCTILVRSHTRPNMYRHFTLKPVYVNRIFMTLVLIIFLFLCWYFHLAACCQTDSFPLCFHLHLWSLLAAIYKHFCYAISHLNCSFCIKRPTSCKSTSACMSCIYIHNLGGDFYYYSYKWLVAYFTDVCRSPEFSVCLINICQLI